MTVEERYRYIIKYNNIFLKGIILVNILILLCLLVIFSTNYFNAQRYYLEQTIAEFWINMHPGYETIETNHFIVKYAPAAKEKAQKVAGEAEKIYNPISNVFQLQKVKKTVIVLEEYDQKKLVIGQFMSGYTDRGVIHLYDDPRDRVSLRITIPHEFSHVMIRHKYEGAYLLPTWIDEGMAFNIENSITGNKIKSADDWDETKNYSIETLEKVQSFAQLTQNPDTIYHQCSGIIAYIIETYGETTFFQILEQISHDRKPFAEAIENVLHIDVLTLDQKGHQYFRKKFYIEGSFRKYISEQ